MLRVGTLAATASLGASTILGSWIVKVDPRPGSLSTVMSPYHLAKAFADREAEAGAIVFARDGCIGIASVGQRLHKLGLHPCSKPRFSVDSAVLQLTSRA